MSRVVLARMMDALQEFDGFIIHRRENLIRGRSLHGRRKIYEPTVGLPLFVLGGTRIDVTSFAPSVFDTRWSTQSIPGWNSRTGSRTFRPIDKTEEGREGREEEDQATDLSLDLSSPHSP